METGKQIYPAVLPSICPRREKTPLDGGVFSLLE